jgi:hypothetical protein
MLAALLKRNFYRAEAVAPDTIKPLRQHSFCYKLAAKRRSSRLGSKPFIFNVRARGLFDVPLPG